MIHHKQLDLNQEGSVVDLQALDYGISILRSYSNNRFSTVLFNRLGNQSVLVYATLMGSIVGWDLRSPSVAWKLEHNLRHGKETYCKISAFIIG